MAAGSATRFYTNSPVVMLVGMARDLFTLYVLADLIGSGDR